MSAKDDSDSMEVDDEEASAVDSAGDDDLIAEDLISDDNEAISRQGRTVAKASKAKAATVERKAVRASSRTNKFISSMADPPESLRDLMSRKEQLTDTDENDDESEENQKPRSRNRASTARQQKITKKGSPQKSPARCHVQRRQSLPPTKSDGASDEESAGSSEDDEEDQEPLKVQRILASRTESKMTWKELCKSMNTSEIHYGSRWFQNETDDNSPNDDGVMEERFLVKWSDLSFLHVSWETQHDLIDQADAKTYLTTFSRKEVNGLLYSPDERCDGDYFDPSFTQVDRILSVQLPDYWDKATKLTVEAEDSWDATSFGMILDKAHPKFDRGTGRQFLVKWGQLPYCESTYEFERDLIMNEVEYKSQLKEFLTRRVKPTKMSKRASLKRGEDEYKRLYNIFGDKSKLSDADRETAVEEYKQNLQDDVYKNSGQLRDYQAEGVAWMIANFVNKRCCILADEMGLGKVSPLVVYTFV
jgi:hypothetical protein